MKKLLMSVIIFVLMVVISTGCSIKKIDQPSADAIKFKEEYEKLNAKEDTIQVNVPENNKIKYATFDDVMNLLENGTGVIYFGFPECPWCRNATPILLEAANDTDLKEIMYFNALSIRDKKHLDDSGNIVVDQQGTKEYYQLIEKLSYVLGPYDGLNDDSIKRLYFPTVVFVRDGKIIGAHEGTLDSQKDPRVLLNQKQKEELYQIYLEFIQKTLSLTCDKESAC